MENGGKPGRADAIVAPAGLRDPGREPHRNQNVGIENAGKSVDFLQTAWKRLMDIQVH